MIEWYFRFSEFKENNIVKFKEELQKNFNTHFKENNNIIRLGNWGYFSKDMNSVTLTIYEPEDGIPEIYIYLIKLISKYFKPNRYEFVDESQGPYSIFEGKWSLKEFFKDTKKEVENRKNETQEFIKKSIKDLESNYLKIRHEFQVEIFKHLKANDEEIISVGKDVLDNNDNLITIIDILTENKMILLRDKNLANKIIQKNEGAKFMKYMENKFKEFSKAESFLEGNYQKVVFFEEVKQDVKKKLEKMGWEVIVI